MKPHEEKVIDECTVSTLKSTDEGVAFLVKTEGKTIYDAGDLHWCAWPGEPEEDNKMMERQYKEELESLKKESIDYAFVVLDPRHEVSETLGIDYFLKNVGSRFIFPMHCWEQYDIIERYKRNNDRKFLTGQIIDITGQEQQFMERVGILGSRHERLVVRSAIGVGILVRAEITVTVDILRRSIDAHPVAVVRTEPVEFQSAAVDLVIELFGDIGHVGRLVELVAPTAKLVNMVVFRRQTRIGRSFVIGPKSGRLGVEFWDVRESVPVAVIRIAVLNHAEQVDAHFVVVGDERAVERRIEIGRTALRNIGRIGQRHRVVERLLGDDVDHAADGVGAEQSRPAAADHLDPFDHGHGQLFQPVHRSQRTENRPAIEQHLRILPLQYVDTQLRSTALAAVVLKAQYRLKIHRFSQVARRGRFEQFRRGDGDDRWRELPVGLRTAGRTVAGLHCERLLVQGKIHLGSPVGDDLHRRFGRPVAHRRRDERKTSQRQVFQEIVSGGVGRTPDGRALHGDSRIGKVLAALRIDDMPRNIRIALFSGFHDGFSCGEAHRRQQEHDKCSDDMFFHWMIRI